MSIRNSLFLIGGMEIKSTFAAAVFCTNSVSVSAGLDSYSRQATWGKRVPGLQTFGVEWEFVSIRVIAAERHAC